MYDAAPPGGCASSKLRLGGSFPPPLRPSCKRTALRLQTSVDRLWPDFSTAQLILERRTYALIFFLDSNCLSMLADSPC